MMNATESQTDDVLEKYKFLWDEYTYRHELIWQRVFRFTMAKVPTSTVPYVRADIARLLGHWMITAPLLASTLALNCDGIDTFLEGERSARQKVVHSTAAYTSLRYVEVLLSQQK